MVDIPMCYSNSTIVNIYWYCCKLVYKIIVNRGGYKITYFVASYRVYISLHVGKRSHFGQDLSQTLGI
jgi:hypothetical protein